jgi:ABC-type lipoprotein release transport system permease subunit
LQHDNDCNGDYTFSFISPQHPLIKFVSIISGFSLMGVTVGVAVLIVVMSVMNGFHHELTKNIIGLNGDVTIAPVSRSIDNYKEIKEDCKTI